MDAGFGSQQKRGGLNYIEKPKADYKREVEEHHYSA